MNAAILGLLAETAIHPGSGRDTGFVDLPVAREAATDYPVVVGSSFKGALLDAARAADWDKDRCNEVFGKQDNAGNLVVSDARLLLLPVRSMTGHYKWVTCPHLLERFKRDAQRGGLKVEFGEAHRNKQHYLGAGTGDLFLEERQFHRSNDLPPGLAEAMGELVAHDNTRSRLAEQLVILSNDDFAWFARYGLSINARNVLDTEKKTSKNLWYEETIPADALFYCLLAERNGGAVAATATLFSEKPYLQAGGNASVGQGWFAVNVLKGGA